VLSQVRPEYRVVRWRLGLECGWEEGNELLLNWNSETGEGFRPEVWVANLILCAVVLSLVSIFLFYLAFAAGLVIWVVDCLQSRRVRLLFPPFTFILVLFLGMVVISIILSSDPSSSARYLKKLIKLFSIFLIYTYVTESQIKGALRWIFWTLGVSALYGVMQLMWLGDIDLLNRIVGFMSHWMTFSGQLMIGALALSGYLLYLLNTGKRHHWTQIASYFLILSVLAIALGLSFTRSAWIGTVGGLIVMLAILRLKWAVLGGLVVLVTFLLLPASFQERFYTSFDLRDTTTKGRVELLKTGAELIQANPWFGVGPRMVSEKALDYRGETELPTHLYQHFHNNVVQIAAEMGLPAALCWMALWIWVFKDCLKMRRAGKDQPFLQYLSVTCICILVAFHLAGLFEYNFGDSEIAILVFFFVTIPYAVDRRRAELGS